MKTQKERMLAGELYIADDPELGREMRRGKRLARAYSQTTEGEGAYRSDLLKQLFNKIGQNGYLEPPFHTDYGSNTTIGDNFYAIMMRFLLMWRQSPLATMSSWDHEWVYTRLVTRLMPKFAQHN